VLDIARELDSTTDMLIFISDNTGDFGPIDKLPEELQKDLEAASPGLPIRRYLKIGNWLEDMASLAEFVAPESTSSDVSLSHGSTLEARIAEAALGKIDALLGTSIPSTEDLCGPLSELEVPGIYNIEEPDGTITWDPYGSADNEIQVGRASLEAEVTIEGFMYKADFYALGDNQRIDVLDSDWNDHTMWVAITRRLALNFHVRIAADGQSIEDIEFEELTGL
jgi:hypothetical protein